MDSIMNYLTDLTPARKGRMSSLEKYAREHRVPIMDPVSMHFLTQLIRIHQPVSILEVGTAIGYSALRMHEAYPMVTITSLEKNITMYNAAIENINAFHKSNAIQVIHGDALHSISDLVTQGNSFDFIFIDAAKGQYKRYFTLVQPLIRVGGIIVCDNVLFKGYVADKHKADNIRLQKIAEKIRNFNEWLVQQTDYCTSIIPIGDGVSISVKLESTRS